MFSLKLNLLIIVSYFGILCGRGTAFVPAGNTRKSRILKSTFRSFPKVPIFDRPEARDLMKRWFASSPTTNNDNGGDKDPELVEKIAKLKETFSPIIGKEIECYEHLDIDDSEGVGFFIHHEGPVFFIRFSDYDKVLKITKYDGPCGPQNATLCSLHEVDEYFESEQFNGTTELRLDIDDDEYQFITFPDEVMYRTRLTFSAELDPMNLIGKTVKGVYLIDRTDEEKIGVSTRKRSWNQLLIQIDPLGWIVIQEPKKKYMQIETYCVDNLDALVSSFRPESIVQVI